MRSMFWEWCFFTFCQFFSFFSFFFFVEGGEDNVKLIPKKKKKKIEKEVEGNFNYMFLGKNWLSDGKLVLVS